jgi:tetratricopeptide (TPR) repeat protein
MSMGMSALPQQEPLHQQTIADWAATSVQMMAAKTRLAVARTHREDYDWLDKQFANLRDRFTWLSHQESESGAHLLHEYIEVLAPYLRQRGLHAELFHWCEAALRLGTAFQLPQAWFLLLPGECLNTLGRWNEATDSYRAAMKASEQGEARIHAEATLALARLLFNQGNYRVALQMMEEVKPFFLQTGDHEHWLVVRAETAAYHLNKGELDTALAMYLEIDQMRKEAGETDSTDHTLLMLGVVYRRKREYERAGMYLKQLLTRAEERQNQNAAATAAHHLGWLYLEQGNLLLARRLCGKALMLYERIGDTRGLSDAYEQLGCIALAEKQGAEALLHVQRALSIRRQLRNQQGTASCLRRMAMAHLTMHHPFTAFKMLGQSLLMYQRLGMMSRKRLITIFRELYRSL